ncbi:hypothetical protein I6F26_34655 [Ensifer sp. IC3342]|nr:hypothetical protein [Ensifer sp. BRP08]MCA1451517.1 hypothetical protein [Ensifer sp. IC3342]
MITKNEQLSDVLTYIKKQQERLRAPKVRRDSEKDGYTPGGSQLGKRTVS